MADSKASLLFLTHERKSFQLKGSIELQENGPIYEAMKKLNAENLVKHRKLIIPGYVAVMSGKLEEATGWEIMVGPRESSMLPKYLQEVWK